MARRRQISGYRCGGFALPLLLIVLASVAVGLAGRVPTGKIAVSQQQQVVDLARQALLGYINAYPESYGPRGAGPGHLPCPDTDGWLARLDDRVPVDGRLFQTMENPASMADDGPNPPCGLGRVAIGWLPRHIVLAERRVAFHVEPSQRLIYAVAADLVNNPPRSLCAPTLPASRSRIAALIISPRPLAGGHVDLSLVESLFATAPAGQGEVESMESRSRRGIPWRALTGHAVVATLTRDEVLQTARRRVAIWLSDRVSTRLSTHLSTCGVTADVSRDPLPVSGLPARAQSSPVRRERLIALLADDTGTEDGSFDVQSARLEGVLFGSHWFDRDGWADQVVVDAGEVCQDGEFSVDTMMNVRGCGVAWSDQGAVTAP